MKYEVTSDDVFVVDAHKPAKATMKFSKDEYDKGVQLDLAYTLQGYNEREDELGYPVLSDRENKPAHERPEACARKTVRNSVVKYFVKISNKGEWLNPLDRQFMLYATRVQNNIPVWQFREVTKTAFDAYLSYLKSENPAYLRLAQRSI